jgi:beta-alanine--pyruvate transaminase
MELDVNTPVTSVSANRPNDFDAFWMPFTWNRRFKQQPLLLYGANGMYYVSKDGRSILDGTAGLWCSNAGHGRKPIIDAMHEAAQQLDYAPSFQVSHPKAFEFAARLAALVSGDQGRVFFCNSGSEAVDSALKIALACHKVRGQGSRTRLIGRERGYHGTGFGGISVGGIAKNRSFWGPLLPGVDHLPHTYSPTMTAFSRGQPEWGVHLAAELENIVQLHDPSTIAAVIVEPIAGSTGVLIPPMGYLRRLREICDKYGILLIFDEVITGFGRLGTSFAAEYFGVQPDLIACAKGLTNGAFPMGAVICRSGIYEAFMEWADSAGATIELFHGYTYSAHPVGCAAGLATLNIYRDEQLFERAKSLAPYWEDAVHSLKGTRHVIDLRNLGLVAGIELAPRPGEPGARGYEAFTRCFERGLLVRSTGDILALSPPLIVEKAQIDQMFDAIGNVLKTLE